MNGFLTGGTRSIRLDVVGAVTGLAIAVSLLPLAALSSAVYLRTIPIVLGLSSGLYLYAVRQDNGHSSEWWTIDGNGLAAAELTGIGLVAIVVLSVLAGTRTLTVVLLSGAVGAFILLQIVLLSDRALDERLVLPQLLAHGFVLRFTGLFTTPGLIGTDSWTHLTQFTASIQHAGSLAPLAGDKYYFAPFYHLTNLVSTQVLDVGLRLSLYLVLGSLLILSLLLVYGTARYFVDVRWALYGTGLFIMADQVIRWGMHIIPTSLGLVFFLGILFVTARILHTESTRADWALLVGFIVAITLTHQFSAFVSLAFLGTAVVAQVLVRHVDRITPPPLRSPLNAEPGGNAHVSADRATDDAPDMPAGTTSIHPAFVFHLLFTVALWGITPWSGGRFLSRTILLFRVTLERSAGFLNLAPSGQSDAVRSGSASTVSELAGYVDAAGFLVLLFAVVLGSLALLKYHRAPQAAYTVVLAIGTMLGFALLLPLFGIKLFLPGRWFAFVYALMAIVGAVGLRSLGLQFSTRAVVAVLVVLTVAFPLTMVVGQKATLDDPTFDDQWSRYAYTESEIDAMRSIGDSKPASVDVLSTDHPYRTAFTNSGAFPATTINLTRVNGNEPPDDLVVYRRYQSNGAPQFTAGNGVVVTGQVSREQICPPTSNYVYDNQETMLCTRPGV